MGTSKIPGPIRNSDLGGVEVFQGTLSRSLTATRSPVGRSESVGQMSVEDRFKEVLFLTVPKLPGEIQEEFSALLTPQNLAIIVGVLAAWAASHYFGVGFVADLILLIGGGILVGWQIFTVAGDLVDCVTITWSAKTRDDLDLAATHLANFVAVVGVAVFMAFIAKGAKGQVAKLGTLVKGRAYYMKVLGWKYKPDGVLAKLDDAVGFFTRNGKEIRSFEGGLKQSIMDDYIKGIDFSQNVTVKKLGPNSQIKDVVGSGEQKLRLIQYTDQHQTNFYTIPGTSAGNLAIPKFDEKIFKVYEVVGEVEVLISKTAGMKGMLTGGANQIIIPSPAVNLKLIR